MSTLGVIILAAGQGKRMHSDLPKPLQTVAGYSMLEWVIRAVQKLNPTQIVTVVSDGQKGEQVAEVAQQFDSLTAVQKVQNGSGSATEVGLQKLDETIDDVLVLNADAPLLTSQTLQTACQAHQTQQAAITILTALVDDAARYGRIVRSSDQSLKAIVEAADATAEELAIQEINAGVYFFKHHLLNERLQNLQSDNQQNEFYLTDTIYQQADELVQPFVVEDNTEILGANDLVELAEVIRLKYQQINHYWMRQGIKMIDPASTYIDGNVTLAAGTLIKPGVMIEGPAQIGPNNQLGPNLHIRPTTTTGDSVKLGNYVEVKNAQIGDHTSVGHLSYVGDAEVGQGVNIGAGTVFVNYDGLNKHQSTVGDRAFIGSGTNLIAPVHIADEAITAAGSTITDDVQTHEMGIARGRQTNKADFWKRMPHAKK